MTLDVEARLDKHEAICAERYEKISDLLFETQGELKALRQMAAMGAGAWKAILGIGALLTLLWTALKISTRF